jgi:hypothetical protein
MPEWPAYSKTFCRIMQELGGWSEQQSRDYLDTRLSNPGFRSWFLHDGPSKEAAPLLFPDDLRESLQGLPWVKLRGRIEAAIGLGWDSLYLNPDEDRQYDWQAARRRVADAIADFRTSNSGGS